MMKIKNVFYCFFLSLIFLSACSEDESPVKTVRATVDLLDIRQIEDGTYLVGNQEHGNIDIIQVDSIVTMTINLLGFPPNSIHAVHIHEGNCNEPQKHWNIGIPHTEQFCNTRSLGIPWAKPLGGDVGNVSVGYDGSGSLTIKTDLWRIASGDVKDLLGKSVVIHQDYEDFTDECDPFHDHKHIHNNPKVACGIIEMVE